ncbi:Hypothetical Protein FCC1311_064832 [Hondaea fermentalgiana]|uniref:Uncharacterized protein n=1 Tax=Hondaea fermentalgiana TaxID=2315210 RepID=A0A2R5GQV5_9STRA|nr:Hypothetical Protein FCC1311_064832 [Hondaea fermentalgiana]|eukprot:GBG30264.1 Hypothetical Protein FCC1311_064832 [Hondaea fermentalgiana]
MVALTKVSVSRSTPAAGTAAAGQLGTQQTGDAAGRRVASSLDDFADELDPELEVFSTKGFDAKAFTRSFYEQHTEAQAKTFCLQLLEQRGKASDLLQRKVFRHYPKFIESASDLRKMDAGLSELRRGLGKTEFVLQSIQVAASNLERLRTFEEKRLEIANRREKERRKLVKLSSVAGSASADEMQNSATNSGLGRSNGAAQGGSRLDTEALAASLEVSRFKKVQSLYSDASFPLAWLIEAPDKLRLLLHSEAYEDAVALVNRVRKVDVDKFQSDLEAKLQSGEQVDTYMLDEKLWALYYAIRIVEEEAESFLDELLQLLERNQPRLGGRILADGKSSKTQKQQQQQFARHPVELISALGQPVVACRGYLRGRRRFIREVSDEVIYGPLATEPEQCILELAQGVFGAILETSMEFRSLFAETQARSKSNSNNGAKGDAVNAVPDTLQPLFVVWAHEEATRFCTNFVRFLIPGFQESSSAGTGGMTSYELDLYDDATVDDEERELLLGDDLNALAMKGIPFASEKGGLESHVSLNSAQWTSLGTCLRWSLLLCRRLEKEDVLLSFVLARQLGGPLLSAVNALFANAEKALRTQLRRETWQAEQLRVEGRIANEEAGLTLTASGQTAYSVVGTILERVKQIYKRSYATRTATLEARIVEGLVGLLGVYLDNLVHAAGAWPAKLDGSRDKFEEFILAQSRRGESYQGICTKIERPLTYREKRCVTILMSGPYSNAQLLGMIADALYVSTDLSTRAVENFEKLFKRRVRTLRKFLSSVRSLDNDESPWRMLCDAFVTRNANSFLEDVLQWSQFNYSSGQRVDAVQEDRAAVSPNFERLANVLADLKNLGTKILGGHSCALDMVASIVEHMIDKLEADGMPSAIFGPVDGPTNSKRLAADLHLLLQLPQTLLQRQPSEEATAKVESILQKTGAYAALARPTAKQG